MNRTTFVTAFIDLEEDRGEVRAPQHYLTEFLKLARTGIPIHLFVSYSYIHMLECLRAFLNVYIFPLSLQEIDLYKALKDHQPNLPSVVNTPKDTRNFMILMNAKVELVCRAMQQNYYGTEQFAWIDFRIFHVLKEDEAASARWLQTMATLELKEPCILVPGCWEKGAQASTLFQRINWRFCGGFFLGDRASLEAFFELYTEHFMDTLLENPAATLTWEVNFWHWLELHHGFAPNWYKGDHDRSILDVPRSAFLQEADPVKLPEGPVPECGKAAEPETSNAL
jgi:hypothetical protein